MTTIAEQYIASITSATRLEVLEKDATRELKVANKNRAIIEPVLAEWIAKQKSARVELEAVLARQEELSVEANSAARDALDATAAYDVPVLTTEAPAQAAAVQEPVEPVVPPLPKIDLGEPDDDTVEVVQSEASGAAQ